MSLALGRRQFFTATAGVLAALGLARLPQATPARAAAAPPVGDEAWRELAAALQGPLLLPGNADYASTAQIWSLRYAAIQPAAIARCTSAEDVRTALLWAQRHGITLVARSGGHSYSGYSATTGLMIDVRPMNQIAYDAASGRARAGGGANNGDAYTALRPASRAFTHGRCKQVGIAGLVLGGGIGFDMRQQGLTCDHLVETEIVTAAGDLLRCNEQENADLFWACRGGGGGNFGVNTSFTFSTYAVDTVTAFDLIWTDGLDALLPELLVLLPTLTERFGSKLLVTAQGGTLQLELLGQLFGAPDELRALLAPAYRLTTPAQETVRLLPYWDAQDFLSETSPPGYSHERSRYIFRPLGEDAARTILDFAGRWPGAAGNANWKIFQTGGAVAAVPDDATAYVHRGAQLLSSIEIDWTERDTIGAVADYLAWQTQFHEAMLPFASARSYQNFIDDEQQDYLHAYYGENLPRLVGIKRRYDPENVFRFPQSIPLTLPQARAASASAGLPSGARRQLPLPDMQTARPPHASE